MENNENVTLNDLINESKEESTSTKETAPRNLLSRRMAAAMPRPSTMPYGRPSAAVRIISSARWKASWRSRPLRRNKLYPSKRGCSYVHGGFAGEDRLSFSR